MQRLVTPTKVIYPLLLLAAPLDHRRMPPLFALVLRARGGEPRFRSMRRLSGEGETPSIEELDGKPQS